MVMVAIRTPYILKAFNRTVFEFFRAYISRVSDFGRLTFFDSLAGV